jgi:hypothetical protein
MTAVLLYDASEGDLLTRQRLLQPAIAELGDYLVETYNSRSEMLARIGGSGRHELFLVLVDLATDDNDRRYAGFEIIETMSRNAELRERTIRVVLTRFFGADMVEHASDLGAHAVIDLGWLQDSPSDDVAETLQALAARKPRAGGTVPYSLSQQASIEQSLDRLHSAMLEFGIVGDGVGWNGRSTLECLIAIAEDVPNSLIEKHNREHARKLSSKLATGLITHGTKPEMARYLLSRFAPPMPRQIEPAWLPDLELVRDWMHDSEIRSATWLAAEELDLLRKAVEEWWTHRVTPRSTSATLQRDEFRELTKAAHAIILDRGSVSTGGLCEKAIDVLMRRMLYTVKVTALDVYTLRAEA